MAYTKEQREAKEAQDVIDGVKTEPKHVIGIGKGNYKDYLGNVHPFTGTKADIQGEGEGLRSYDRVIIRVYRADRPTTKRNASGTEGYVSQAQVLKVLNTVKMGVDNAELANKHTDWKQSGNPDEFLWYLPAGKVKQGDNLKIECPWEDIVDREGRVINQTHVMNVILPE